MKFERRDCVLMMAFLLLLSASLSAESQRIEMPADLCNADIERLDPYPVTTNSTDVNKVITLFSDDLSIYSGAEVAVCYDDGSCYRYKTDTSGQIHTDSSKPVQKIIILSFGRNKEASGRKHKNDGDTAKIPKENVLDVYLFATRLPMAIDVSQFPADDYEVICVHKWCGISN